MIASIRGNPCPEISFEDGILIGDFIHTNYMKTKLYLVIYAQ